MIRTISIYAALGLGLLLAFAGFFAVIVACWFLAGTAAAMVSLVFMAGTALAGLSARFINDRLPEDDGWGEGCAPEGANVVSLRGRG